MNVETTLETHAQFAETGKPDVRALDHPAMPPELLLAFYIATRDTGRDATPSQVTPTAGKVITPVRMQFARALTGPAIQARHCCNRSSSTVRRRPPFGGGVNTGISGSCAAHNSLLIFRLTMPPGYGFLGLTSRLC
jgi:hypothetical protein